VKIDVDENKETAEACDVKVHPYNNNEIKRIYILIYKYIVIYILKKQPKPAT
jgi:hypothetical protein